MNIFTTLAVSIVLMVSLVLPAYPDQALPSGDRQTEASGKALKDVRKAKKTNRSVQSYQDHEQKRRAVKKQGLVMRRHSLEQGK